MIHFDDVSLSYAGATAPTLEQVSFTLEEGDLAVVVGRTGTGKSTLLGAINGLVPHFTGGLMTGEVTVDGRSTRTHRPRDLADVVGWVGQDPLAGFVTDTVADEIAYGMEQLGVDPDAMRKRVEETLDLMGIAELRARPLADLSGGQQQRVAIAAVLAAQPRVLVLDEPTSALDPTAAQDVLSAITTLVHEVGLTVVLAEHRLERVLHQADTLVWLPSGRRDAVVGPPAQVLLDCDVRPPLAQLSSVLGWDAVPASVRDARRRAQRERLTVAAPTEKPVSAGPVRAHLDHLRVAYGATVAVNGVSLDLHGGEVTCLMGRNGAGKSSLLWAMQGGTPSTGTVTVDGTDPRPLPAAAARALISLVPQTAADLLYLPRVADELAQADRESGRPAGTAAALLAELGADLAPDADPRDLSEGQRLSLVLAIQLAASPGVLALDEPTRGLDYAMKDRLAVILAGLAARGHAVVVSTHDVEFAATATQRTIVMADGDIIADGPTRQVCVSSPTFAPQTAKVFAPVPVLIPAEVRVMTP
ncbi:MAG: ATP-binding cassette domain-containing protein [Propioniciclava sp.]|uniref:ABC transporter ATP-binding protein n=1 Tax=Propioniciclava sp. TaxID=2038686 RepID=UPI0039E33AF0